MTGCWESVDGNKIILEGPQNRNFSLDFRPLHAGEGIGMNGDVDALT